MTSFSISNVSRFYLFAMTITGLHQLSNVLIIIGGTAYTLSNASSIYHTKPFYNSILEHVPKRNLYSLLVAVPICLVNMLFDWLVVRGIRQRKARLVAAAVGWYFVSSLVLTAAWLSGLVVLVQWLELKREELGYKAGQILYVLVPALLPCLIISWLWLGAVGLFYRRVRAGWSFEACENGDVDCRWRSSSGIPHQELYETDAVGDGVR